MVNTAATVALFCGRRWLIVVRGSVGGFRPELGGREATKIDAGTAGVAARFAAGFLRHRRGFVRCRLGKGVILDPQSAADGRGLGAETKRRGWPF